MIGGKVNPGQKCITTVLGKSTSTYNLLFFLNECAESALWPFGPENLIKTQLYDFRNTVHKSLEVNIFSKLTFGFRDPWSLIKAIYCLTVCVHGETMVGETASDEDSSEWRKLIEMHLESKLIFSAGQRTGYGNKKRDVIRFSCSWSALRCGGSRQGRRREGWVCLRESSRQWREDVYVCGSVCFSVCFPATISVSSEHSYSWAWPTCAMLVCGSVSGFVSPCSSKR